MAPSSPSLTLAATKRPCPHPNSPIWINHISFRVDTVEELENTKARLQACGVEVLGVTDHHIFKSIYFFDPNGIRLELTAQLADANAKNAKRKHHGPRPPERMDSPQRAMAQGACRGKTAEALKPQSNDRPNFVPGK